MLDVENWSLLAYLSFSFCSFTLDFILWLYLGDLLNSFLIELKIRRRKVVSKRLSCHNEIPFCMFCADKIILVSDIKIEGYFFVGNAEMSFGNKVFM